ncbi:MAG TPA: hypothetical protein VK050_11910 [Flavobacteriaceae bacterium]|nr:hypothetical protein [Flavobacteriaceae bacterium]
MITKEGDKKVLIVTYYWPPAGGPGVQRWLKFVSYLPQFGIEPIVYIPENPAYPIVDENLQNQVPEGITIIKQPIREPGSFAKKLFSNKTKQLQSGILPSRKASFATRCMLYIRANFFIPDARVGWVKPSIAYLKKYCKENHINTLITSGPPHSLHLIGLQLQKEIGVKWLADFRDPWTTIHYFAQLPLGKRAIKKHKELEKEVLAAADCITVTSNLTQEEFKKLTNKSIYVVTNGYDAEQLPKDPIPLDTKFSIAHIGSLLSDRNPKLLWKALADLIIVYPSLKEDLQITLAGVVSEEVLTSIADAGLENYVQNLGYISHTEAIRLQHASQILLLLEMDKEETKVILPGKLFEYMAAKRPILALGPEGGAIEPVLKETNAGVYYSYQKFNAIYSYLERQYLIYRTGTIQVQSNGIATYSREAVSKKMAAVLHNL